MSERHEPQEAYEGLALVTCGDVEAEVPVRLRGRFDPIDGRFHWYGRLQAGSPLDRVRPGSRARVATSHGTAAGRLTDVDTWGRLRVSGVGRPPF